MRHFESVARLRRQHDQLKQQRPVPPEKPKKRTKIVGWDHIAAALEVSDVTAQSYAGRDIDPLPVFYDHASRPAVMMSALNAWMDRQTFFFRTYHVLREANMLPGQVRLRGEPITKKRRKATKAGVRSREKAK